MAKVKKKVWLVQKGVWDLPKESMPLASGYLKAIALADEVLRSEFDVRIFSFGGGASATSMVREIYFREVPDIVCFSIFGWNFQDFGALAETFRMLNPEGWIIAGGNHVTRQAKRLFGCFPPYDVVVNGEGEYTFKDLLFAYLAGTSKHELSSIPGISYKNHQSVIVTTPDRERIQNLDELPSPFLTEAIPMHDRNGDFRYELVLQESNRGCPYKCSFCYWGGAIGQKVRSFSRDRLRAELDYIGYHKAPHIVLCDANFGMLKQDEQYVDDLIETREKYGYPKQLDCSWAKNKSKTFYSIVNKMKKQGFRTTFGISLQTLNDQTLHDMQRKNMKINDWEDLIENLQKMGLEFYAELIWGAPGETYDTFLEGYDRLAKYVQRIAIYPMLLLPNTYYSENKEKFGIISIRQSTHDFEYVLANNTITVQATEKMNPFLFWARVLAEYLVFRAIFAPLRQFAGITQSQVLLSFGDWIKKQDHPVAKALCACLPKGVDLVADVYIFRATNIFHSMTGVKKLVRQWWESEILPKVPADQEPFFRDLIRYEQYTWPIYDADPEERPDLPIVDLNGESYFVRENLVFDYDFPQLVKQLNAHDPCEIVPKPCVFTLYYLTRFSIENQDFVATYRGKTRDQIAGGFTKEQLEQAAGKKGGGRQSDDPSGQEELKILSA